MYGLEIAVESHREAFSLALDERFSADGITAVFGPSGAGKSTLLRVIAGLERGARGTIRFAGETWLDRAAGIERAPHRRGIGFVFQDARLLPFLSVAGNLRYAARRGRDGRGGFAFDDVVAALDVGALCERAVTSLSGGERQRVAIARALLTRPRLLLMDEPLSANDIRRKAELLPYVRRLPGDFGVPVIYVSHALDEVAYLADRVLVLDAGRVRAHGAAAAILERLDLGSASARSGTGAVLRGRLLRHDEQWQLSDVAVGRHVLAVPRLAAAVGASLRLVVQARDVALAVQAPRGISIRNVLPGTVLELVEAPGSAYAEALIDIGDGHLRSRLTRAAVADLGLAPGSAVFALVRSVSVDAADLAGV